MNTMVTKNMLNPIVELLNDRRMDNMEVAA